MKTWFFALFLFLLPSMSAWAEQSAQLEKYKAVFIYNFARYVEWPTLDQSEPIVIAMLGDGEMARVLEQIAKKRTVKDKRLQVSRCPMTDDLPGDCHILFVSANWEGRLEAVLKAISGRPILTVGDAEGMAQKGLALNFVMVDGRLKFEVNKRALVQAGLQASSQLLKLGIPVESGE